MTLTIYEGFDKSVVYVKEAKKDGMFWTVKTANLYKELSDIASYVNNELGDECFFEIE